MVRSPTQAIAVLLLLPLALSAIRAQDAAAVAARREAKLVAFAIESLHELADRYEADNQHGTALRFRREILLEYSENDAKAREKCGFGLVGAAWRLDAGKVVIDKDLSGTPKVLKKIERDCERFRREQLGEHRSLARAFAEAGDTARAARHWRRVLALAPDDKNAIAALSLARFQGFRGTADELVKVRRAWALRGAVDWLRRHDYPVARVENGSHPLLERAGLAHEGWRTENFTVWGALPGDQLPRVAQNCERALALCRTIFGVSLGHPFEPRVRRGVVMVADENAYQRVLDQCADQFDPHRLEFLKTQVDMAFLMVGDEQVRFIKTNGSEDEAFDQSVRGVVQDATIVQSEGLWEGVGHAGCGLLFGKTITFLEEQLDARTVASWAKTMLAPDMATWQRIAEQSAWGKSDTRTSELVLVSAARFTTEQRVKAWAICDWFFHWRPELLLELDDCHTEDARTPPLLEAEFERRTGIPLPRVDAEWRDFWARQAELRAAMRADPLGEPEGKDRKHRLAARELVDAIDAARIAAARGPVGFYLGENVDTEAALEFADRLVRAEREQQRKPKEEIPLPEPPAAIGANVLLSRRDAASDAVADWLRHPVWRDALLHPGRGLLGANRNDHCLVLDLGEPVQQTQRGAPLCWPRAGQGVIDGSAPAGELGATALAALAARGKTATDVVAVPFTLHFAREISAEDAAAIAAQVYFAGKRIDGVLVDYQDAAGSERTPGLFAWIGLEAPPGDGEIEITWTLPAAALGDGETFPVVICRAR
ncbi:MAG: hypothetical protein KDE27_27525 [Planctomycetes bacterium]|nr:hypothetical protein [Planctomycetota bacterium]